MKVVKVLNDVIQYVYNLETELQIGQHFIPQHLQDAKALFFPHT